VKIHRSIRIAVAILVGLTAVFFLVFGAWLAALGGSWYYLIAGVLLFPTAFFIGKSRASGPWLYLIVFFISLAWALWEVGLDGWQLMPRLLYLAVLGILVCLVDGWRRHRMSSGGNVPNSVGASVYVLAIVLIFASGFHVTRQRHVVPGSLGGRVAYTDDSAATDDWRYYGRTAAGQRYAPQQQISPRNVKSLREAWRFRTGDTMRKGEDKAGREFNFEATPIKVADRLYLCTPHRQIIAIDATTGKQVWRFDPATDTSANEYLACRGVAYYQSPAMQGPCASRIISATADARMVALDAQDGKPCADFGNNGFVSLTDHMGRVPAGFHFITSQPLVMEDKVVLGGWIYDNQARGEPSGVVRAYDPVSGKLAWAWDLGRAAPTAPLAPGETYTRGTPNAWGTYTADPKLGLIYLPLGNATPDYFGGMRRPFDERYSSSIVALDIKTGRERWHFQTVHHDVWDYDLPIGPTLVDLPQGSGTVPALIQTTKGGQLFVLNRETGVPLTPIVERPVPTQGGLRGDRLSGTQPFVEGFPSLAPTRLSEKQAWGALPFDQLMCRVQFRKARYDGQYTPPSPGLTLAYPAFDGIVDWYGATVDPVHDVLIANTSYMPFTMEAVTTAEALKKKMISPWTGWTDPGPYPKPKDFSIGPQYGTPYVVTVKPWLGALEAPCIAPPWGELVALDLRGRKILWRRPVGTTRDMNIFGIHTNLPLPTGMFTMGGNIVTGSGLVFMGATADDYIRAFDESNGNELWRARLPAGGQATPMTYVGADGRQYVVISAGGHGGLRTRQGDWIVAYALPKTR
jgi:quinoprotein glucose dehydrogenase